MYLSRDNKIELTTMTSIRAKRNSKVPNRFSSDNSQIETANANGETIIDYNNKTTSTTHNLVPNNRTIKLKPAIREPLKVKLPKLKRLQSSSRETNSSSTTNNNNNHRVKSDEIKIHKIKLPSLSKKSSSNKTTTSPPIKPDSLMTNITSSPIHNNGKNNFINIEYDITNSQTIIAPKNKPNSTLSSVTKSTIPYNITSTKSPTGTSILHRAPTNSVASLSKQTSASTSSNKIDISTSSISTDSSFANSSFSSDDNNAYGNTSSRGQMEIVVSQSDVPNSSGIKCPCGVDDDLGVMVECESCSTWQHGHCINLGTEEEAYEGYTCAFCNLPQDKARDSLLELTVGDKFQTRFKVLDSLRKQTADKQDATTNNFYDTTHTDNNSHFTTEELTQAIKDLMRVLNSLKVKFILYEKPTHDEELRIWQNCFWSENQTDANNDKNLYIYDRCRSNLKLNIRNMLKKMDERCKLIDYIISAMDSSSYQAKAELDKLRESLLMIVYKVKEYKMRIKTTQSN